MMKLIKHNLESVCVPIPFKRLPKSRIRHVDEISTNQRPWCVVAKKDEHYLTICPLVRGSGWTENFQRVKTNWSQFRSKTP